MVNCLSIPKVWTSDNVPKRESNMAGIGSDEDRTIRRMAAFTEPAWEGVGLRPGLWVWRIECFKVVPWPREMYGQFHEGDSYIVLNVLPLITRMAANLQAGGDAGKAGQILRKDIHFWLGRKTSIDEKGTAAYKTVELDDYFDGSPRRQRRELQGRESSEFQGLFPSLKYLPGGVDSGFNITGKAAVANRLFRVWRNERRQIIVEEEKVNWNSLNHRDCFILDTGGTLYTWFGDESSPFVKNACNMKAKNMLATRNGKCRVTRELDEDFWRALGGEGEIPSGDHVGAEVPTAYGEGVLYACRIGEEQELEAVEVGRGELTLSMLDPGGVMLLDTKEEIIVWLGKDCQESGKRTAFKTATKFLKMSSRSVGGTSITVLKQGMSTLKNKVFADNFALS